MPFILSLGQVLLGTVFFFKAENDWFRSYLSNRCQQFCIDGSLPNRRYLNCGVSQVCCLGPLLFVIYSSNLFKVIERHLPEAHC